MPDTQEEDIEQAMATLFGAARRPPLLRHPEPGNAVRKPFYVDRRLIKQRWSRGTRRHDGTSIR